MKKTINLLLKIFISIISLVAGVIKIVGTEFELRSFDEHGISSWVRIVFGITQALGGLLILHSKTETAGLIISMILYAIIIVALVFYQMLNYVIIPASIILAIIFYIYSRQKDNSL